MTALLEANNLAVSYRLPGGLRSLFDPSRRRSLNILQDVSLKLEKSETMGLVGESGSGKTTLIRAMLGLTKITGGTLRFEGKPLASAEDFGQMRRRAAMMFQDPIASLSPRMRIGDLLSEPAVIHGQAIGTRTEIAERLLDLVGLPRQFARRFPHELSGGQARRVGVARALALDPALILADEPTAGLDVSVQGDILNLLARIQRERGVSAIIVTHNLAMVRHVSDRLAILYLGRLVETGPTQAVFKKPAHPYTKTLLDAEPKPDPTKRRSDLAIKGEIPSLLNRPSACEFHTRCPLAQSKCRTDVPEFQPIDSERMVRCHFPLI